MQLGEVVRLAMLTMALGGMIAAMATPIVLAAHDNNNASAQVVPDVHVKSLDRYSELYIVHINQPYSGSYVGHRLGCVGNNWRIYQYCATKKSTMYGLDKIEESNIQTTTRGRADYVEAHSTWYVRIYVGLWPFGHYEYYRYDVYTEAYQYSRDHEFVDYFKMQKA